MAPEMLFASMKIRIALVENFGLDFLNFRVPLVKFLEKNGYEVYAVIPDDKYSERVKDTGIKVLTYKLKKNRISPVSFFRTIRQLILYQRKYGFSIIHTFRLQPNIIASLSFPFNKKVKIINHITGLGFAFTERSFVSFCYKLVILFLYQVAAIFSDKLIVQNSSDQNILSKIPFTSAKLIMIEGSGIDQERFNRRNADMRLVTKLMNKVAFNQGEIIIVFTGRLLMEKGIIEFLTVADKLSMQNSGLKFVVAGWFDINNPSCLTSDHLDRFLKNKNIIYLGEISEIRELLYFTDIFVLPTYREGFPRSVLEAMAMNVAVITTDVPGARDAVIDNFNGLLVAARDKSALEEAILKLIGDQELRKKLGINGRKLVENKYNTHLIFNKIMHVYQDC
jgi:glycosyltransferase involved in cell wall biosynthesis